MPVEDQLRGFIAEWTLVRSGGMNFAPGSCSRIGSIHGAVRIPREDASGAGTGRTANLEHLSPDCSAGQGIASRPRAGARSQVVILSKVDAPSDTKDKIGRFVPTCTHGDVRSRNGTNRPRGDPAEGCIGSLIEFRGHADPWNPPGILCTDLTSPTSGSRVT